MGVPQPGFNLRDRVTGAGSFQGPGEARGNSINVEFVPDGEYQRGNDSAAATWGWPVGECANVPLNLDAISYLSDHGAITLLAHEVLHALGVCNHVSTKVASIMEGTGAIHQSDQDGVRKPLSFLYRVDREALQAP